MSTKMIMIILIAVVIVGVGVWYFTKQKAPTGSPADYEAMVQQKINVIKADEAWLASVTQKALDNGVSLGVQLRGDAIWSLEYDGDIPSGVIS